VKRVMQVLLLLAGMLWAANSFPSDDHAHHLEVTARRFSFVPDTITAKRGDPLVIELHSLDAHHGLKFQAFNVQIDVPKGETRELEFIPTQTGTFVGMCSHFCGRGHGEMKLTLIVTE
jgi:cytochrome c oxidase subunit II